MIHGMDFILSKNKRYKLIKNEHLRAILYTATISIFARYSMPTFYHIGIGYEF
jgi:hypothetical protein